MKVFHIISMGFASVLVGGCAPAWSVKLPWPTKSPGVAVVINDHRPTEEKDFRFDRFLERTGRSYLADSNTNPNRIEYLRAELAAKAPPALKVLTVEVYHFDILQDRSGSLPKSVASVPGANGSVVPVPSDSGNGSDRIECALEAESGGRRFRVDASIPYKTGIFDGPMSDAASKAVISCLDSIVSQWTSKATDNAGA